MRAINFNCGLPMSNYVIYKCKKRKKFCPSANVKTLEAEFEDIVEGLAGSHCHCGHEFVRGEPCFKFGCHDPRYALSASQGYICCECMKRPELKSLSELMHGELPPFYSRFSDRAKEIE